MPAAQVINLNSPRGEPTALERTADSFSKRYLENKSQQEESDALKAIYGKYQEEGWGLEQLSMAVNSDPQIPPARKVAVNNQLNQLSRVNLQLQKETDKKIKEDEKKKVQENLDKDELKYLQSIKGKNLTPLQIYEGAAEFGLPRISRNRLANLSRMEGREARLSQKDIASQYAFEIKELDNKIKELNSERDRKPLRAQKDKLLQQRNSDLARYRKGERDFNLAMYGEEAVAAGEIADQIEEDIEEVDPFIQILDKNFPANQVPIGTVKWLPAEKSPDGKKHSYKSDGKKWIQIS